VLTIYGIRNCDTCRKAQKWLDANSVKYHFHDVRADGLEKVDLARWAKRAGWQKLLNTRSTTWRSLPESARSNIDETSALQLMQQHPTLIKRPVLELNGKVLVGFSAKDYAEVLLASRYDQ